MTATPSAVPPDQPMPRRRGRRILVLGGAGAAIATLVAGYLLTSSGSDDVQFEPVARASRATPTATDPVSVTASPTTAPTDDPVDPTPGGRNPFSSGIRGTGTGSPGNSTDPAGEATSAATVTVSATVTATASDKSIYLALFGIDGSDTADFRVNTVRHTEPEDGTFGTKGRFHYKRATTVDGEDCAKVSYLDDTFTICVGEVRKVA